MMILGRPGGPVHGLSSKGLHLKMMNFVLKMMNFVLMMMNFVSKAVAKIPKMDTMVPYVCGPFKALGDCASACVYLLRNKLLVMSIQMPTVFMNLELTWEAVFLWFLKHMNICRGEGTRWDVAAWSSWRKSCRNSCSRRSEFSSIKYEAQSGWSYTRWVS